MLRIRNELNWSNGRCYMRHQFCGGLVHHFLSPPKPSQSCISASWRAHASYLSSFEREFNAQEAGWTYNIYIQTWIIVMAQIRHRVRIRAIFFKNGSCNTCAKTRINLVCLPCSGQYSWNCAFKHILWNGFNIILKRVTGFKLMMLLCMKFF